MSTGKESSGQTDPFGEILGEDPTHVSSDLPSNVFSPWHLPRKHYVRTKQWVAPLANLLPDIPDRQLITYLGLPGEDLLDLQLFSDLCKKSHRRFRYLGFDQNFREERLSTHRIVAEQLVRQSEVIDEMSKVLPDPFASIAQPSTVGGRSFREAGSYDVVNLDLCDAFTTRDGVRTHAALLHLLTHQTNHRGEPWLFYLTTRSEVSRLQAEEIAAYLKAIDENARRSQAFRQLLAGMAALDDKQDVAELLAEIQRRVQSDTYLSGRWLTIGIGKWLLGIMGRGEPWRVSLLSVYSYRTGLLTDEGENFASDSPNLFSLVFRFDKVKQVRQDPIGLAQPAFGGFTPFNEVQLAEKLVNMVKSSTIDVDRFLQANPLVHAELAITCEELLGTRYYSREHYKEWVSRFPRIPDANAI